MVGYVEPVVRRLKNNKLPDVLKLILIYNSVRKDYGVIKYFKDESGKLQTKKLDGVFLIQKSMGDFLGVSKRNMVRLFQIFQECNFLVKIDEAPVIAENNKYKPEKIVKIGGIEKDANKIIWRANVYQVNEEAINDYLLKLTGYNILENLDTEVKLYNEFMTFCKRKSIEEAEELKKEMQSEVDKFENEAIKREKNKKENKDKKVFDETLTEEENEKILGRPLTEKEKKEIKDYEIKAKLIGTYIVVLNRYIKKEDRELLKKRRIEEFTELFSKYVNYLDELNRELYTDERLNIKYLKDYKRRASSHLCTTANPKKNPDSSRIGILETFFKEKYDNIISFDTNASIYRLSYALGNDKIANFDDDFYKRLFDECHFDDINFTNDVRDCFKHILMRIYMRESSIAYNCKGYDIKSNWTFFYKKEDENFVEYYRNIILTFRRPLRTILYTIRDAMHNLFNLDYFFKSGIFIHESNLHILMLKKFKDMGIKAINVYDGFYFIKDTMTQELYNQIYSECLTELLIDYSLLPDEKTHFSINKKIC